MNEKLIKGKGINGRVEYFGALQAIDVKNFITVLEDGENISMENYGFFI